MIAERREGGGIAWSKKKLEEPSYQEEGEKSLISSESKKIAGG
jgi:hypothetical protein